jgi:ELWxxDGT repeat protein
MCEPLETRRLLAAAVGNDDANVHNFFNGNGTLLYLADDGVHGTELWKSDGTAAGTVMVKDITPGGVSSAPQEFVSLGGFTYFLIFNDSGDTQLWKTDGTGAGTQIVADIRTVVGREVSATQLQALNGELYLVATHRTDGREDSHALLKSDGTAAGTTKVTEFAGLFFNILGSLNGSIMLDAFTSVRGNELWKTDGTAAGTMLVKDIRPGTTSSYPGGRFLRQPVVLNNAMYFIAETNGFANALWKTDGTNAGTVLVSNLTPTGDLSVANNAVYFTADDGHHKTDGTTTASVTDAEYYFATSTARIGNEAFYTKLDNAVAFELFKTDGTTAQLVKDINPGDNSAEVRSLVVLNNTLYFTARDGVDGTELWKSDGTAAGTVKISNLSDEFFDSPFGDGPFVSQGQLFLSARDDAHGNELWHSDGTLAGTVLVKDANTTAKNFFGITELHGVKVISITGTAGNDVLTFTPSGKFLVVSLNGKNGIMGLNANGLFIETLDGNDTIDGSAIPFDIVVQAGEGDDSVSSGHGKDIIAGVGGNDTIFGNDGDDSLDGGAGDDSVWGNNGNDTVLGQDGVDSLYGNGGNDRLEGGANSDHMRGNAGRDRMYGNGGNDKIYGGESGDWLYGGPGADQMFGEGGDDRLYGDDGFADTLHGNAGNDTFITQDGVADQLFGDGGHDTAAAVDADKDILTSIEESI